MADTVPQTGPNLNIIAIDGQPVGDAPVTPESPVPYVYDKDGNHPDIQIAPSWGTRALCELVLPRMNLVHPALLPLSSATVLDPCAGLGHMSRPLTEYFAEVSTIDIHDYGYPVGVADYLEAGIPPHSYDWVVMFPPHGKAEEFVQRALTHARQGVALLAKTTFLEGVNRNRDLFTRFPCHMAQFSQRLPVLKNKCNRGQKSPTAYAWFIWLKNPHWDKPDHPFAMHEAMALDLIPPCRLDLEQWGDYDNDVDETLEPDTETEHAEEDQGREETEDDAQVDRNVND